MIACVASLLLPVLLRMAPPAAQLLNCCCSCLRMPLLRCCSCMLLPVHAAACVVAHVAVAWLFVDGIVRLHPFQFKFQIIKQ